MAVLYIYNYIVVTGALFDFMGCSGKGEQIVNKV
jgi:hypothetical protein